MAGDWIKWTCGLLDKPEVIRMASSLRLCREIIACRLMKFWEWCDSNIASADILDSGSAFVTLSPSTGDNMAFIDALVGTPGFADSLSVVGWIRFRDDRVELPNFGLHNGETAKTRARNAKNQQRLRSQNKDQPPKEPKKVTTLPPQMSPQPGDKSLTRGEESIQQKNPPYPPPGVDVQTRPPPAVLPRTVEPRSQALHGLIDLPSFEDLVSAWTAARLPGTESQGGIRPTATRRQMFQLRLQDDDWRANWRTAIDRLARSSKARGGDLKFPRGVRLEDFLRLEDYVQRILEGEFDDPLGKPQQKPEQTRHRDTLD